MRIVHKQKEHGFTLIELLAVITILGLLATVVVMSVVGKIKDAKIEVTKTQIQNFENALKMYKYKFDRYPRTDEGLDILAEKGILDGGYVPPDPWKNKYEYYCPSNINFDAPFDIISYGADGRPGGDDENADITNHSIREELMRANE